MGKGKFYLGSVVVLFCCIVSMQGIPATVIARQALPKGIPDLWLKDAGGHRFNAMKARGKVVFINFWAMSCIPCREEMPSIDRMKRYFAGDSNVIVLSVDLGNDVPGALAYFRQHDLSLQEYTVDGVLPEVCFKGVLPTTLLLDKKGRVVFYKEERYEYDTAEFLATVRRALDEPLTK